MISYDIVCHYRFMITLNWSKQIDRFTSHRDSIYLFKWAVWYIQYFSVLPCESTRLWQTLAVLFFFQTCDSLLEVRLGLTWMTSEWMSSPQLLIQSSVLLYAAMRPHKRMGKSGSVTSVVGRLTNYAFSFVTAVKIIERSMSLNEVTSHRRVTNKPTGSFVSCSWLPCLFPS